MQKFEILFQFAYTGRYLTKNTGTGWYLVYRPIESGIWPLQSWILMCTLFLPARYGKVDIGRYGTIFILWFWGFMGIIHIGNENYYPCAKYI